MTEEKAFLGADLRVELIPISGSMDLFVNPAVAPQEDKKWAFESKHGSGKVIIVNKYDYGNKNNHNLFIKVRATGRSKYYVRVIIEDDSTELRPNVPYTGSIEPQTMKNFKVILSTFKHKEHFEVKI